MKKNLSLIARYAAPHKAAFMIGIIFALVGAVLQMLFPNSIHELMNYLQFSTGPEYDFGIIGGYAVTAGVLILTSFVFSCLQSVILSSTARKVSCILKAAINDKLDRLPVSFFYEHRTGDIQRRVTNDVDQIATALSNNIASIVCAVATLIVCIVIMVMTNGTLTLVAIGNAVIGLIITVVIVAISAPFVGKRQEMLGAVNAEVYEAFGGHLVIKAFNCEKDVIEHFGKSNHELSESSWKAAFFQAITMPVMNMIAYVGFIAVTVVGTVLIINDSGNVTIGDLLVFLIYSVQITNPLRDIAAASAAIQPAAAAAARINEILSGKEISDAPNARKVESVAGDVVFDHVKFGYLPDQIVLKDLSAVVKAGQKVAIVGPTGAGKSTMVNLLMRFYDPQEGRILLDGVPISEYTDESLHSMLGMVLQDTWTFEGSIRDNILYSSKNVTEERLNEIVEDIGLSHLIKTLPDGLDTVLTEDSAVSAGQKQLITIGRAMAKNSPVLILDEATSSVDTRTEKLIQNALDKLTADRTSFVIAHRLSTIKNADCIFYMKDGDVAEIGTHEELLAKNGYYAELYNSQFAAD